MDAIKKENEYYGEIKSVRIVRPSFELKANIEGGMREIEDESMLPWPHIQFGIPNKLLRSAIFGVQRERKEKTVDLFTFLYNNEIEITFMGPRLNQDDSIVWQSILRAIRNVNAPMGAAVAIKKLDLLEHIGKIKAGKNYNWLMASLDRLSSANLKCIDTKRKETFTSNLIIGYHIKNDESYFNAGVSSFLAPLLSSDLTDVDIIRKSKLTSQLSRWLHDFYSSHTKPIPYSITKIQTLCRSEQVYAKFKMNLKKSIEELKRCDPPLFAEETYLDTKADLIHVVKATGSPFVPASTEYASKDVKLTPKAASNKPLAYL